MPDDTKTPTQFDGFEGLNGISGMRPDQIPSGLCENAFNRSFRFGVNRTRTPLSHIQLTYANQADQFLFEGGNGQGGFIYESYPTFDNSYLFVSIAGTIFQIQLNGNQGTVTRFFDGNDPVLQHAWFVQGFNWMVIQDGTDLPIVWDGTNSPRRSNPNPPVAAGQPGNEISVGSVMAFNQGYIAVCSSDGQNQIAVSNQVYSTSGQAGGSVPAGSTQDLITFSYQGPGQNPIGSSIFIGDVNGLFSMPAINTGTGQGQLFIVGTDGIGALNLSGNRDTWVDSQIATVLLVGVGCYSSHSLCSLNGDLIFRNTDGIFSFRNSSLAFSYYVNAWNQSPISLDVRKWIDTDRPDLVQFSNQISWNNYVFSTIYPVIFPPNNPLAGFHRCFKGILALDSEPASTISRQGTPIWQGVWTGIRPWALVEGRIGLQDRAFAFSYDIDGKNRLYEFQRTGTDDSFNGAPVQIESWLDSANLGNVPGVTNNFVPKVVGSVETELSNLTEPVQVNISIRPDSSPCYVPVAQYEVGCGCPTPPATGCPVFSMPNYDRRVISGLEDQCISGTSLPLKNLRHWQSRLEFSGYAELERQRWSFVANPNRTNFAECEPEPCMPVQCCPYGNSFAYSIAPPGTNPNIPFILTPSDAAPVWNSTQFFTAQCPDGTGKITVSASAQSTVSQANADSLAYALAQQRAVAQLKCSTCQAVQLVEFSVQGTPMSPATFDLSAFFAVGYAPPYAGQQWRLIDQQVLVIYANGVIDPSGTLQILNAVTTGNDTFNPVTHIFTDISNTLTPVALETGCPGGGDILWPAPVAPYSY
jgi:hypothetical protein